MPRSSAWLVAMTSRQIGHFFFEPRDYDVVNQATHEHKEEIKVGYNLQRKVVLMSIWALSPLPLYFDPTLFGIFEPHAGATEFIRHVAQIWLAVGLGGLLFRTVQLFFIKDVQTGLVWVDENPDRPVPRHQVVPQGAALPAARRIDRPGSSRRRVARRGARRSAAAG